ncbi:MAG: hypothetical protein DIU61_006990 [Bacteroidota bacterium]
MKPLIVYYSHGGNNELLAYRLQKEFNSDIFEVEPAGKRTGFSIFLDIVLGRTPRIKPCPLTLSAYDMLVFVAPIWSGKIASPLRSFLTQYRDQITSYAFMSLCGGGMSAQVEKVRKELTTTVGRAPIAVRELWVLELPKSHLKANPPKISGYRVTPEDINYFVPDIHAFVEEVTADVAVSD